MQEEMCLDVESCWALGTAELQQLLLLLPSTAGIVGKWERGLEVERNGTARASAPVCVGSCSVQVEQPAGTWWLCLGYSSAAARYPSGSSPGLGWPCSCTLQPVAVGRWKLPYTHAGGTFLLYPMGSTSRVVFFPTDSVQPSESLLGCFLGSDLNEN